MGRLLATSTTQLGLSTGTPPWVWSGKPAAQWGADHTTLEQMRIDEINKRAAWRAAAATWDLGLGNIHRVTRDVKREGVYYFRAQPAVLPRFRALRADAESRERIYNQGEAARALWAKADGAWVFDAEVEISAFGSLLANSLAEKAAHANAFEDWRTAASKLKVTAQACDQACVAWYAAATRKFKAGTAQGDTIRSTVPTTYVPPPPVGQAVFSNILVSAGTIHLDCTAPHATRYAYLHMPPGATEFLVLFADSPLKSLTLENQAPGLHRFQAIPRNAGGEGEASAVIEITVAQQQAA